MTIKEQVLSIADRLKVLPASAIIKVMMVFLRPARDYWGAEANKHCETMNRYPEGTSMRAAAEKKYHEAFVNWHRLNYLSMKLNDAEQFKSFDDARFLKFKAVPGKQAPSVSQAA